MNLDGLCSCSRGNTCGYHMGEFFSEQGFSREETWLLLLFEFNPDGGADGLLYGSS